MRLLLLSLLLLTTHALAEADFSDCTKTDQCKKQACDKKAVEEINTLTILDCLKIFKMNHATGMHEFAYYELGVYAAIPMQKDKNGKHVQVSENAATVIRLK